MLYQLSYIPTADSPEAKPTDRNTVLAFRTLPDYGFPR